MKKLLSIFFMFLLIQTGYSQTIDKTKLDHYFQTLEANNKFMGSVAIAQGGKLLYTNAIGFRVVEEKLQPNEHTKYRIGSISKTFTAALLFKAIDEKRTELSQTLNNYYPTVKNSEKITLAHLLNHHSGIHNFTADDDYSKWNTQKQREQEMITLLSTMASDFEPGTKAAYSNSNYVLLTFILQKIYKNPYAEILKDKIVKPLGLTDTYYGGKIDKAINESYSYQFKNGWIKQEETDMSIPGGAGAIVSTPTDLTSFAHALFNGKIVSGESLEKMKTMQDGYGMGLFEAPFHQKKGYVHNGGIDGFSSNLGYFPEGKVSIALTSNGSAYDNNKISMALLSSVFNIPYELPVFITVSAVDLDQYLGVYSSKNFPLKITISKSDDILMGQATGQPSFKLDATAKPVFNFDQAGLVLQFNPDTKEMTLKQGGRDFLLFRE
jgi:D-alanyl-D-alanine carboxypeptidase